MTGTIFRQISRGPRDPLSPQSSPSLPSSPLPSKRQASVLTASFGLKLLLCCCCCRCFNHRGMNSHPAVFSSPRLCSAQTHSRQSGHILPSMFPIAPCSLFPISLPSSVGPVSAERSTRIRLDGFVSIVLVDGSWGLCGRAYCGHQGSMIPPSRRLVATLVGRM